MLEKEKKEIDQLRKTIEYHNKKYYDEDSPEIEDFEYDMLIKRLEELEERYPQFSDSDSPTNYVGGNASAKFSPVRHAVKMESLHDSFSEEELLAFDERVKKVIENPQYIVEPKIDGLSVSIEYKNGHLFRGSTRGDGATGEDITENILTIKNLPKQINKNISLLIVRGEVYMPKETFAKFVKNQVENGLKSFKNPRNAAAGSLRQKESKITESRNLEIFIFNIQQIQGKELKTHKESLDYLKKLGFPVPPFYNVFGSINETIVEIKKIGKIKTDLPFMSDGAVIKINNFKDRELLGSTSKFPRWAEAFKYPPEEQQTKLLDIEINVGRTGVLTPTGILEPILVSGSTVGRVVLHNQDFIDQKSICIGDTVIIRKAGEIIPEVVAVAEHSEPKNIFKIPKTCPSCGADAIRAEGEAAVRCMNLSCPAQLFRNIVHFVSRDAMNITGVGESLIKKFIENKLIFSPADFYDLIPTDLSTLEGLGEKSALNILKSIENSKNSGLSRVIFALGIRNVGQKAAKILAKNFKNIKNLINASLEEIEEIQGLGNVISQNVIKYFSLTENLEFIERLKKNKINMNFLEEATSNKLDGMNFVLTGTLKNYNRNQAKAIIESLGGNVSSSVSKNTSYVVSSTETSSKLKKAQELGIKIINEEEFAKLI